MDLFAFWLLSGEKNELPAQWDNHREGSTCTTAQVTCPRQPLITYGFQFDIGLHPDELDEHYSFPILLELII